MKGNRVGRWISAVTLAISAGAHAQPPQPAPPQPAPPQPAPPQPAPPQPAPPQPAPPQPAPPQPAPEPEPSSPDEQPGYDPLAPTPPAQPAGPMDSVGAPPYGRSLGVLARVGLEFGGDELAKIEISDGRTQTLQAGELTVISAGIIYQPGTWALEATLGYKNHSSDSFSNGSAGFSRFPLDVIASFAPGGARIGAGVTVHFDPKLSCDITSLCTDDITFDNAFGAIVQLAYGLRLTYTTALDFAARYTFIHYAKEGYTSPDGSGLGLLVGVRF